MRSSVLTPARYQLKKEGVHVLLQGHPWIFRDKLSSAAQVFDDGQWLKLVDATNTVVGYGIFEKDGLIAIRVLKRGPKAPDTAWFRKQLDKILQQREAVRGYTNAFRA